MVACNITHSWKSSLQFEFSPGRGPEDKTKPTTTTTKENNKKKIIYKEHTEARKNKQTNKQSTQVVLDNSRENMCIF